MDYNKNLLIHFSINTSRCLALIVCLLYSLSYLQASITLTHQNFSEKDGLSHGQVTQILQDPKGYVWMSTWNGLNLFDGKEFHLFKANPGDNNPLVSNRIDQIHLTSVNNIWCLTKDNGRVYLFNYEKSCFEDVFLNIDFCPDNIFPMKSGHTWLTGESCKVYCVNDTTLSIQSFSLPLAENDRIYRIFADNKLQKWFLTSKGVFIYNRKNDVLRKLTDQHFKYAINFGNDIYFASEKLLYYYNSAIDDLGILHLSSKPDGDIQMLTRSARNELAIGFSNQFILYNTISHEDSLINLQHNNFVVKRLRKDINNNYWGVSANNIILKIDAFSKNQTFFSDGLKHHAVNASFTEDKNGIVWVIASNGELYYYTDNDKQFHKYRTDELNIKNDDVAMRIFIDAQQNIWAINLRGFSIITPQLMPSEFIMPDEEICTLHKDNDNNIWIASKEGCLSVLHDDHTLRYLNRNGDFVNYKTSFCANIYSIFTDKNNNIWLGTKDHGIYFLKKESSRYQVINYRHSSADTFSLSNNSVYSICADQNNRIWIATFGGGINLVDYDENDNVRFINYNNDLKSYPVVNRRVRNLKMLSSDIMGAATTNGLITFSTKNHASDDIYFFSNTRTPGDMHSISDNNIISLMAKDSVCYAITYNGGLNQFSNDNLLCDNISFNLYGINKGAPSETGLSALQVSDSVIWVSYESAISFFDIKTNQFVNFQSDIFGMRTRLTESDMIFRDGLLYIASNKGLIALNTGEIEVNNYESPVIIKAFNIKNRDLTINPDAIESVVLEKNERNFTISFAAINYNSKSKPEYAVFMEGIDEDWNYLGSSNSINFNNISPGQYNLKIKATNSNGIWNDSFRTIHIDVPAVFHETIWAKILYILLISIILWLMRIIILRIKLLISDYRKALHEARQKRLSATLNPVRPEIESGEKIFLERLLFIVESNISNSEFTVDELSSEMAMGRTNFYTKIKELLGVTPVDFIRETRIKRAMQLLETGQMSITEVAYACGFSDPKFFSKTFKKLTCVSPNEYKKSFLVTAEKDKTPFLNKNTL